MGEETPDGLFRSFQMTFVGIFSMPMSILGGLNVLQLLRDPRPALRVSEQGILNHTFWSSVTTVHWEEIVEIRGKRPSWILELAAIRERKLLEGPAAPPSSNTD